ncbi:MAG: TolC family protein [Terriglobales bacterium]
MRLITPQLYRLAVLGLALILFPWASSYAQDVGEGVKPGDKSMQFEDYSKPRSHFPNPIAPYEPRGVPPPSLSNSQWISTLIRDGKLMLSLNDAIALTLENNLDIGIARYNLNIADTDVLRTKAGATVLGVNAGVVQNTPGGGVGGLSGVVGSGTGGTSVGTAGAGSGTNGLVSSTLGIGSTVSSFDPILNGTLQMDRNHTLATSYQSGVPIINTNTGTANFNYQQGFRWGTLGAVTFDNSHITSNNTTPLLSPEVSSNFQVKITQPLLQGFGSLPNTRYIVISENNRKITDVAFHLQVITTVDQIENLYWNLVYAVENVKVEQDSLDYAQTILKDTKTQVKYGVDQPIQIANAEATAATNQQALILAETNLRLQELLMKNAISRVYSDPILRDVEVVPTSTIQTPTEDHERSTEDLVKDALAHRAELAESQIDLSTRQLSGQAVANSLLPVINVSGYYGGSGLGGDINPRIPICTGTVVKRCFDQKTAPPPFQNGGPVSYAGTLSQLVDSTATDKGVIASFDTAFRNRAAQANQVRSELELRQAQIRLQQLENQIRIEVLNALFDVQQNRASVAAAQQAVELAKQTLYAEKRRLDVGVSDPDNVLQQHAALVTAQSNLLSAQVAYEEALVELGRATGLLLENNGILISDARQGRVTTPPQVPGITQ